MTWLIPGAAWASAIVVWWKIWRERAQRRSSGSTWENRCEVKCPNCGAEILVLE